MRRPFIWLTAILLISGCKRSQPETPPAPAPAASSTTRVAVAASQPVTPTFMLVGQQSIEFPHARLVVKQPGDKLSAMLFSVDPPAAINGQYRGNSFYFDLADLTVEDPASINHAVWVYRANDSDRQDSNDGLFINGRQIQLQPFDVQLIVDGENDPVRIKLSGTFLKYDNTGDPSNGVRVNVRADFEAELRK